MQREYLRFWLFTSSVKDIGPDASPPTFVFKAFDQKEAQGKALGWLWRHLRGCDTPILGAWIERVNPDALDQGRDPESTEDFCEIYKQGDPLDLILARDEASYDPRHEPETILADQLFHEANA